MKCTYAAGTQAGRRDKNEDSFVCMPNEGLWLVTDGVGGLVLGESASAISAYTLGTMISAGHGVNHSIEATHGQIREYASAQAAGANMGATLVLLLSNGTLYNIFWAGDSRAYLYDGGLTPLTTDHTHLQLLIDEGKLVGDEAGCGVPAPQDWDNEHSPSSEAMAEAVSQILDNREACAQAARKRAVNLFDVRHWCERHRAIFESLL